MEGFQFIAKGDGIEELRLASNGLSILLLPDPGVPVVAVCVVYHVGSRNEAVGHTGATHLLEHLLFKGSEGFDPARGRSVARVLERVGAAFNATTWFDRTNYYETLAPEHLELALEIEADRMHRALLREQDLASEITVVRNELERGENDPFDVLLKNAFATAFREHPYHHPTIGWRSDVEHATIGRLREFYETFYTPDNATLIIAGAFEPGQARAGIERQFSPLAAGTRRRPVVVTEEPRQEGERRFVLRRAAEVGWVSLSWRAPRAAHPDTYPLSVLADALAGGVTSRLYQRLVETGRCLDVQAIGWQLRDPGLFQLFATLNEGIAHAEIEETLRNEVAAVAREGLRNEELERAKAQVEAHTAYHRDSPGQVAAALAEAVACADWRFYLEYLERIRAVTSDAVVTAATRCLEDDSLSVGWFVPQNRHGGKGTAGRPVSQGLRPRPCFQHQEIAPRVHEIALEGGARALLLPRPGNPTVHLQGSLLAGHGMLPDAHWSAASLVPDMLERGTVGHDRLSLARLQEDRGIELDVSGEAFNPLEVFAGGRCLSRDLPLTLELLFEMLRQPTFPSDELERLRQLRLGELVLANEDTFLRAFEAFCRLCYEPPHPHYRRPFAARREGLEAVSREELAGLAQQLYGPSSLVLAFVGAFDLAPVVSQLERLCQGWSGGRPTAPTVPRRMASESVAATVHEELRDKPSIDAVVGQPGGLRRSDQDFVAAVLGNAVLGHSTLSSRLGKRLRDQEGWSYGVNSRFFGASLIDGPWAVTFSVAAVNLDQAVAAVREEVTRFWDEGPTEAEVDDERSSWAGSTKVALATSGGIARELARLARHGRPLAEIDDLPGVIRATTRAEVVEAVRRHLDPARLSVAAAGQFVDRRGNGS